LTNGFDRVKKENPLIAHDLSEVRRIAILAMITPMQEADFIEELMQVCFSQNLIDITLTSLVRLFSLHEVK
jgi:hypothetical protein